MAIAVKKHTKLFWQSYLLRAYSRPILCSTNEHCPTFVKIMQSFNFTFFHKKVPFLSNTERCAKFLEYALLVLSIKLFDSFFRNKFLKCLNKCAHETGRKSSSNPAKSKSSNQSKICSKFQRCIFRTQLKISAFVHWISKKLYRRCSTGSSIPTPLKLLIKTPEQHHSSRSCVFVVDQILCIDFHAYLTYFRNSCFHRFE